jgi:ATP-binding cassette subfamily B (MDR/TAP) protein 1
LRVFGCTAYAHVDNGKLEPRVLKCIFLAYGSGEAYKLWNPETKRILMSMNVLFNEAVMFTDSQTFANSDVSDDEQHRASVQVEHVEEKENDTAENNDVDHEPEFDDTDNHFVPPSPPVS